MKKIILLALISLSVNVFSQRVIVYNHTIDTANSQTIVRKNVKEHKNAFSWNYAMLVRGAVVFDYQRKLNNYLVAEANLGITLIDFWHAAFQAHDEIDFFGSGNKYSVGLYAGAALKIFPKQVDDMEGWYLAPLYRHRGYNHTSNIDGQAFKRKLRTHETGFVFGWQGELWTDDLQLSSYIGVGYLHKKFDAIEGGYDYETDTSSPLQLVDKKSNAPVLFLGMTLGFTF